MKKKSLEEFVEISFKKKENFSGESRTFGVRVANSNRGIYCESYNLDKKSNYLKSKNREYVYHIFNSTVISSIRENSISFRIWGEDKEKTLGVIKEKYKDYRKI